MKTPVNVLDVAHTAAARDVSANIEQAQNTKRPVLGRVSILLSLNRVKLTDSLGNTQEMSEKKESSTKTMDYHCLLAFVFVLGAAVG